MYFLGTPHRGSSSASYVKTYLAVVLPTASKAYVKELLPDSQTVNVSRAPSAADKEESR
jgi:hypothetical protein